MLKKINEESEILSNIEISQKSRFLVLFTSFIMSLLIVIGPITILANCMIFYDYIYMLIIGIAVFVYLFLFLFSYFYYTGLSKGNFSIKYTLIFDAIMFLIVVVIICSAVIIGGRICGLLL